MNSKKLDLQYVLKGPIGYGVILLLAIIPYFVVDYQTCFLNVQASNPNASLLKFIRHVLIEKFGQSLAFTIILFASIYVLSTLPRVNLGKRIRTVIFNYLRHSIWILIVGFILYAITHVALQSLFSSHHPIIQAGLIRNLVVFHFAYFFTLFYSLIGINIIKSLSNKQLQKLEVSDGKGKCMVDLDTIDWVVKENGIYELRTSNKVFRTDFSINYFEKILDSNRFVKVNRAAIVRKELINGYNYWEHDKYLLRVGNMVEREFVVSRQRMKSIRSILN